MALGGHAGLLRHLFRKLDRVPFSTQLRRHQPGPHRPSIWRQHRAVHPRHSRQPCATADGSARSIVPNPDSLRRHPGDRSLGHGREPGWTGRPSSNWMPCGPPCGRRAWTPEWPIGTCSTPWVDWVACQPGSPRRLRWPVRIHVHFTPRGARRVGQWLDRAFWAEYRRWERGGTPRR